MYLHHVREKELTLRRNARGMYAESQTEENTVKQVQVGEAKVHLSLQIQKAQEADSSVSQSVF